MGSVCGVITGSLMALGLAGVDDPQAANDQLYSLSIDLRMIFTVTP